MELSTKYRTAVEKNIKIISESETEDLFRFKFQNPEFRLGTEEREIAPKPKQEETANDMEDIDMNEGDLWVDKYHPRMISDLVGNQAIIKKLKVWLKDWDDVVLKGKTKPNLFYRKGGGGDIPNPNAKAALISGSPVIYIYIYYFIYNI